jgi:hypothetical protein
MTSTGESGAEDPHDNVPQALVAVFDEGDAEGIRQLSVKFNIDLLPHPVQNILQETLDYARTAVAAMETNVDSEPLGPELWMTFNPAKNRRLQGEDLLNGMRQWILRAAFRDAMESAHIALENARLVLAVRNLPEKLQGEEFNRLVGEDNVRFNALPLRRKMEKLQADFGLTLDSSWKDMILGLNDVRNCVVHRFGEVGLHDVKDGEELAAIWQTHRFLAGRPGDERLVGRGDLINEGETLRIQRGPRERIFRIGTRIDLSMRDLNEICYTIHLFACHVQSILRPFVPSSAESEILRKESSE